MLFDSHAHLDDERFCEDRDTLICNLNRDGVDLCLNPASDISSSRAAVSLSEKYPFIYAAAGVHPHEVKNMTEEDMETLRLLLAHEKCVALGEIGLDYYYDLSERDVQRYWFERQLVLAKELDMSVIIHDREAHAECFDAVVKHGNRGVFHCYSGSKEMALELVKAGFYISFTGVITFKNAKKFEGIIEALPFDRIMVETDSPYLAPEPLRGTRNEPKNVRLVAQKISDIKGVSLEQTAGITKDNAKRLFGIGGEI